MRRRAVPRHRRGDVAARQGRRVQGHRRCQYKLTHADRPDGGRQLEPHGQARRLRRRELDGRPAPPVPSPTSSSTTSYGFVSAGVNPTTITAARRSARPHVVTQRPLRSGAITYTPPTERLGHHHSEVPASRTVPGARRTRRPWSIDVLPTAANAPRTSVETRRPARLRRCPSPGTGLNATVTGGHREPARDRLSGNDDPCTTPRARPTPYVKYKVTDSSGLESAEDTVTVTIAVPAKPSARRH